MSKPALTAALEHAPGTLDASWEALTRHAGLALSGGEGFVLSSNGPAKQPRISPKRRAWAEERLAQHAELPEERLLHTLRAGHLERARALLSALPTPCTRIDIEAEAREILARSDLRRREDRENRIELARAYLALDRVSDAAEVLDELNAARTRSRVVRFRE